MRRVRDAWVLAAVAFLLAASFTAFFGWNRLRVDATAYWDAGTHLRRGEPLYPAEPVPALAKAYLYPPAFAAAFAPLTALPPLWGYAAWMALEVLFAIALARAGAALAGLADAARDDRRTALAIALAAALVPVFDNVAEGQVNLLIAWLCAVAVLEAERGRDARAAFALAAAVHVKLVPIVLAGAFALWRRPRLLGWLAVALVTVALLPWPWRVATLGARAGTAAAVHDYGDFWHVILGPAARADEIAGGAQSFAPNYSLRGTLARLFVAGTPLTPFPADAERRGPLLVALPAASVNAVGRLLGLGVLGAALVACRRTAADPRRRAAAAGLLLTAGGLAGPTFWPHHLVVLGVAGAGLWRALAIAPRRTQTVAWVAALGPLAATLTVPFAAVQLFGASETGVYRDVRELGLPTAAVLAFLVTGLAITLRRPARAV